MQSKPETFMARADECDRRSDAATDSQIKERFRDLAFQWRALAAKARALEADAKAMKLIFFAIQPQALGGAAEHERRGVRSRQR
jgi:hypothetical protein